MSETASIYVHLDWHIGHYVKVMLDEVFGEENFVNEVIWKYFGPTSGKKQYPNKHDNIYFYTKAEDYTFNFEACMVEYDEKAIKRYDKIDADGKKYKFYNEKNGVQRKAYIKEGTPTEIFEIAGEQNPRGKYTPDFLILKRKECKKYQKSTKNKKNAENAEIEKVLILETKGCIYYTDNDFRAKENFVKKTFLSHNEKFQYHCFVDEENKNDFSKHRNRLLEILKNF